MRALMLLLQLDGLLRTPRRRHSFVPLPPSPTHPPMSQATSALRNAPRAHPALDSELAPLDALRRLSIAPASPPPALPPAPDAPRTPEYAWPPASHALEYDFSGLSPDGAAYTARVPENAFTGGFPLDARGYVLSSNPPNARNVFRTGDWICRTAGCAAHNFG
ncbi:hypothetical protein FA95DRAFT_1014231 [Auriscalpium vulgare]|uniref:Uncharacterized protein n=1 Tax=Auriscalpium vulgare TaxID=40419 RepID=A0ACB8R6L8_9AGAM|nr:hypothetical protein FA95DRAFT_1014231 [Auriscalpium vulgare]